MLQTLWKMCYLTKKKSFHSKQDDSATQMKEREREWEDVSEEKEQ